MVQNQKRNSQGRFLAGMFSVLFAVVAAFFMTGSMIQASASVNYNAQDQAAIKKIIKEQKANGASLNGKIDDGCSWTLINGEYRLTEIQWYNKGLSGKISFAGLTELRYVYCGSNALSSVNERKNANLDSLHDKDWCGKCHR